ncbi:hypothetical protein PP747_gp019 [Rhizobium phage RHph_Y38]|uniref:Uncharacterized protein n=2 Tax=Acanvirus TaxID=3044653 RepID=A0A7S5R4E4_9CAUD|nr:hypothetical protein PP747_gp019 [Rhizobium phage RHph_Y38]YP_010658231.1 hypothetical protein PP749_gp020 [Rhizobium phage RHEph22]QIG67720.1 hypothetical protein EVB52_019 [Rhizobium phage RHph_Y38]QXV74693.1 hypothetical protein [Rhizobium phage RHEph22]
MNWIAKLFKRKPHQADAYFKAKLREQMGKEAFHIVCEAKRIRHQYPDLSGPELVRLVYWGASGEKDS